MPFEIYLKTEIAFQINHYENIDGHTVTVNTLDITDGLFKKGDYYIPIDHILFIKEI